MAAIEAGCAHIRPSATAPTREPTPYEQVLSINLTVATVNNGLAKAAINANRTAQLTDQQTERITTAQFKVADANKALTGILRLGPDAAKGRAAEIRKLLGEIKAVTSAIAHTPRPPTDPITSETVYGKLDAVFALADQMLLLLENMGVLR